MNNVKFDLTAVLLALIEEVGKVARVYIQCSTSNGNNHSEE